MFFTELVLKNPTIPSDVLVHTVFNKLESLGSIENQSNYLRQVIAGYVSVIYEKIEKYYSFVAGTNLTIEQIIDMDVPSETKTDFEAVIEIQSALINDPNLTKEEYIERLNRKLSETPEEENGPIQKQIELLHKMDAFFNHSPIASAPNSSQHIISSRELAEMQQMGKEDKYSTLGGRTRRRKARKTCTHRKTSRRHRGRHRGRHRSHKKIRH